MTNFSNEPHAFTVMETNFNYFFLNSLCFSYSCVPEMLI